jgi:hypothetical protein
MNKDKDRISGLHVAIAMLLLVGSAVFIFAQTVNNKKYKKKWEDYDDCGIF